VNTHEYYIIPDVNTDEYNNIPGVNTDVYYIIPDDFIIEDPIVTEM
jgi:hypothetical protein